MAPERFFGVADSRQKIYKGPDSIKKLEAEINTVKLPFHYRNRFKICTFADGLAKEVTDDATAAVELFGTADDLDRLFMSKLPLREYLELEAVWPLRPFEDFVADCISWSRPAAEEPR